MKINGKIITPSQSQHKAISHTTGPLMILAGAGTGKTFTLLHRISYLISSNKIKPQHTVLCTFTEKAANEAKEIIKTIIGDKSNLIFIGTFHSLCLHIMQKYGQKEKNNENLWHESDIIYFLINHFDNMSFIKSRIFSDNPIKAIKDSFIPFFSRISDEILTVDDLELKLDGLDDSKEWYMKNFPGIHETNTNFKDLKFQLEDLINAYSYLQNYKLKNNAIDFGDMILKTYELLINNKSALKKIREEIKHIFIDEYQDNNYGLNKIVNLIARHNPSITVVGDEDQCIYSFRGANYHNINDFRNRYKSHPDFAEVKLLENRRSTQEILDIANASINFNSHRTPKFLRSYKNHKKNCDKPLWIQATKVETLELLPQIINSLIYQKNALYGDVAIICRGWRNAKETATKLENSGVPVDICIEKFFDVPIVKDIISWGHLISGDDLSNISLFRILKSYMGNDWTSSFFQNMVKTSVDDKIKTLVQIKDENPNIEKILFSIDNLKRLINKNFKVDEIIWEMLSELKDTRPLISARRKYNYIQRLNIANTGEILNIAGNFLKNNPTAKIRDWLSYMEILSTFSNKTASRPDIKKRKMAVKIMTIHQSKGLQFPYVIIPFLYSNSFPSSIKKHSIIDRIPNTWKAWNEDNQISFESFHLSEERRIFYVGITRAMEHLILIGPTKRQSIFTKELDGIENLPMEKEIMTKPEKTNISLMKEQQKLLVKLNQEISVNQLDNARKIIDELEEYSKPNLNDETIEPKDPEPLNLSSSKIETYNTCPRKYRIKFIDRVPERKTRSSGEFGSIVHKVLEDFHGLKESDQSKEVLFKLLEQHWNTDAFEYKIREEEFKKQAIEILSDYFIYIKENPPIVIEREKHFSFDMEDINVTISGKIDRIDDNGEMFHIVDYKTSKRKEKAKNNIQMALYTEALLKNSIKGAKGKPGQASLHYLRFGEDPLSSHIFSNEELDDFRIKVKKVADGIRSESFETKKEDFNCRYCDYKEFLCPAWEQT